MSPSPSPSYAASRSRRSSPPQSAARFQPDGLRDRLARWRFSTARPEQNFAGLGPASAPWVTLVSAGRGWGKTRAGSAWILQQALARPGRRLCMIAPTHHDLRHTLIEGPSGLQSWDGRGEIEWQMQEAVARLPGGSSIRGISAERIDRLRGPEFSGAWLDEAAAYRSLDELWPVLEATLRGTKNYRVLITTTPRPLPLLRRLRDDPSAETIFGRTEDNPALPGAWVQKLRATYAGRTDEPQELDGQILDADPRALWSPDQLARADAPIQGPYRLGRVVVGLDPAVTSTETADETGLVVAAVVEDHPQVRYLVLDDLSGRFPPEEWARRARQAARDHQGTIIAEDNQGGELIDAILRQGPGPHPVVRRVHAAESKEARALPVAALYGRDQVRHRRRLDALSSQMQIWVPGQGPSPSRVDALVWALRDLSQSRDQHPALVPNTGW